MKKKIFFRKIYAIEKNEKRFNMLEKMLNTSGATCVETLHSDSMLINSETCPGVEYILLDPSCSGSGKYCLRELLKF